MEINFVYFTPGCRMAVLLLITMSIACLSATSGLNPATTNDIYLLEQLNSIPKDWTLSGEPLPTERIRLRIALHQQNAAKFEQTLLDISTPGHPKYGKHMKRDQLKAMLRPTDKAIDSVLWWLVVENNILASDIVHDSDWIHFNITVAQAENLLHTKFNRYHNTVNGDEKIRTLGYSIPTDLRSYITMIQPTTRFGQMRAQKSTILEWGPVRQSENKLTFGEVIFDLAACNATLLPKVPTVTPECLRHLYNLGTPETDVLKNYRSKFGIGGFLEQWAQYADLETFLDKFAPYAAGTKFSVTSINGGVNTQGFLNSSGSDDHTSEANLDVQYGISMSFPVPVNYYTTGGLGEVVPDLIISAGAPNTNEPYLDFLHYVLALPDDDLPQTLSISYGEDEQSVPEPYVRATCNLFAQLGARGVSVLFSSGDGGVGQGCETNDGTNRTRFLPQFPAACPWVTSVGATYGVLPEQAVFFSGGGFSDLFDRPTYQEEAVTEYLKGLGAQWEGLYNPYGRAFPDVAAQGLHLYFDNLGNQSYVSGTSCSSPTFASIVALLNNDRLNRGQPVLGFLNPWIYSTGKDGLTDIIHGGSNGCTANNIGTSVPTHFVPFASWNATVGWDPVTGWGTPNFKELLHLSRSATEPSIHE